MISIVIIGSGNVAHHLIKAISNSADLELVQVFSRNKNEVKNIIESSKIVSNYNEIIDADLYIIAVSDYSIAEVSSSLPFSNRLIAHTSGSFSLDGLDSKNRKAVFYPLQTFSKKKEVNFDTIPICIEATTANDYEILNKVAKSISKRVYKIDSSQRKSLHIAAVFVSNFVNHLYQMGNEICAENKLDFEILNPLILETANKIITLSPNEAQTGPAKRNDTETINAHLNFLSDKNQIEIYKMLTKSIIDNGEKL